jgi:DNA topoisomerase-3
MEMRHEPDPRMRDAARAGALAKSIRGQSTGLSVAVKPGMRRAPLPFDLATFQKTAERLFGWGAQRSLENLQASYEAKLTSYPRTDCRHLPADHAGDALRIAQAVSGEDRLGVPTKMLALMRPSARIYDSSKVAEHHGLAPTGVMPPVSAAQDIWQTWALVSLQFLASLLPDEAFDETIVKAPFSADGQSIVFSARGESPKNPGASWADLDMHTPFGKSRPARQVALLPALQDGQNTVASACDSIPGKTTPPEPYTEAGLIADMRAVAKFVDDPKLKAKLKETSGIGTAATQASILETLKRRGFAWTRGKALEPTELGVEVIDAIPPRLADPGVTAAWEDALSLIAKGQYDPTEFMRRVDKMVDARIAETQHQREAGARIRAAAPEPGKARKVPTASRKAATGRTRRSSSK